MKKLTTLFILGFISFSLFAEPQIPKNFFKDTDTAEHYFVYVSNDLNYSYAVWSQYNSFSKEYTLYIEKSSLLYDNTILLEIMFSSEKNLDSFIKTIHLSDIENEFNRIRRLIISKDNYPCYNKHKYNYKNQPIKETYYIKETELF